MKTNYRDRQSIYGRIFDLLIYVGTYELPTPLEYICEKLNIEIVPLSKIIASGSFTEDQVFSIWGNENGHLMPWRKKDGSFEFKIAYNDSPSHKERKFFTLAEELAHYTLEHFRHPMYSINNNVTWDEALYEFHEESARIGAGLIICPPPVFYEVDGFLDLENIRYFCGVSEPCARTRFGVLVRYRNEIISHPKYKILSEQYAYFMRCLPCPACGCYGINPEYGACPSCIQAIYGGYTQFLG